MRILLTTLFLLFQFCLIGQEKTDNLPGATVFSSSGDTVAIIGRSTAGFFGSIDVGISVYDRVSQAHVESFHVGSSGVDNLGNVQFDGSNLLVTGSVSYSSSADDFLFSNVDLFNVHSWTKVYSGSASDKVKAVYKEDTTFLLIGTTQSAGSYQSLAILRTDLDGNLTQAVYVDYGEDYFPTALSYDDSVIYVSGFVFSSGITEGTISKIPKDLSEVVWTTKYGSVAGNEIQSLFVEGEGIFYAGWNGIGAERALLLGEIDSAGVEIWSHSYVSDGFYTINEVENYSNDSLLIHGHLRNFAGTDENEIIGLVAKDGGDLSLWIQIDSNRSFGSDMHFNGTGYITGSFQNNSSWPKQGSSSFWSSGSSACFFSWNYDSVALDNGITHQPMFLAVSGLSLTQTDTLMIEPLGAIEFDYNRCSNVSVNEINEECEPLIKRNCDLIELIDPCGEIERVKVYDLNGRIVCEAEGSELRLSGLSGLFILRFSNSSNLIFTMKVVLF